MRTLHPSLEVKEFVVKEGPGFRLRVKKWKSISPADLNSLEFTQECLDTKGAVESESTYNFSMTDAEIAVLCSGLQK